MENRKHTRLSIEVTVELNIPDGPLVYGKTKDISFGGMYVNLEKQLNIKHGDKCGIALVLQDKPDRVDIIIQCKTVRLDKGGIGFKFVSINAEDYLHFKYLMINHSPEPELLQDELTKHPGIVIQKG